MNEKLEQIFELPVQARIGIAVGLLAVIVALYAFVFYPEVGEALTANQERIQALQDEIAKNKGIAANLTKFEAAVKDLDVELYKALKELPDKKEIDNLLASVSDKARDAGLDIRLFQPMPEKLKDFYAEVPVQIEVIGSYHQVATFFDEVAHLERIVNVTSFDMVEPKYDEERIVLKTNAVATSFRFLEESERPKEEKGRGKGKKRGRRG